MEAEHFLNLKGQNEAWDHFIKISGNIPQTSIVCGPQGVGKKLAIRLFFQWLECKNRKPECSFSCNECPPCTKITNNHHPDLIMIDTENEQISVDDIREIKKQLYFAPFESKYRFITINDAHKLGISAANSLLKTLEEPPHHTKFFLITHQANSLLPTILSRSHIIRFSPLNSDDLLSIIQSTTQTVSNEALNYLSIFNNVGIQKSTELNDQKKIEFLKSIDFIFKNISSRAAEEIADFYGPEEWKLELALEYILVKSGKQIIEKHNFDHDSLSLFFNLHECRHQVARHANRKLNAYYLGFLTKLLGEKFT